MTEERKRSNSFHLRLTDEELADLKEKAHKAGLKPQAYIHAVLQGHQLRERPSMDLINVLRSLTQINNHLHQIAYEAHSLKSLDTAAYRENIDRLESTVHELLEVMYGD